MEFDFYKGRKVFVTGHTGFKGSYLVKMLHMSGAEVTGYALEAEKESAFNILGIDRLCKSVIGDIRDFDSLFAAYKEAEPEIVFHLAAQPIVLESYKNPRYTYETNVMGTVNILECVRLLGAGSVVNVTTDKVYKNREWEWGYRENEELDGFDPYSNSKSCSELVTASYKRSFLNEAGAAVSTMRAGNVIGGGDFAKDRIIPDCCRAAMRGESLVLRNPMAVRPFQHVLEPIAAYMTVAAKQLEKASLAGSYNVGPDEEDAVTAGEIANMFKKYWGDMEIVCQNNSVFHEANYLRLDNSKIKSVFKIKNTWNIERAVEETVKWTKCYSSGGDTEKLTEEQIKVFLEERV